MTTPAPIKVSFGLKKVLTKSTTFHSAAAVPSKSKPSFSFGDDDDDDAPPLASTSTLPSASSTTKTKPGQPKISTATLSRAQKLKQQQDIDLDSSVYEYDEVYDNMKEGSRLASLAKQKDAGERKVRHSPLFPPLCLTALTRPRADNSPNTFRDCWKRRK